ncbi:hypothetical protein C5167_028911 [Papaver somniferum]|uniref:mavicyanin-like n=1 Tax=Papaver somniferum TaxID=3469 RepID=UPI000E70318F|nr:mavicyanin-like [Papaver somniferum]RZC91082.1 hypothetical protein C5167_028911 [Papaver somniferum]
MGLALERVMFFMALAVLCVTSSMAEVYMVGDGYGWTSWETGSMPDYKEWSASKAFKIGDSIVFEYEPEWHNVVQVSYENYKKCNASSPIKTFTSGIDLIPIKAEGHLFYICGVSDHCEMGQKVDIRVVDRDIRLDIGVLADRATPEPPTTSAPAPSSSAPAPSPSVSAPAPSPSNAVTISKGLIGKFGFVILAVAAVVAY